MAKTIRIMFATKQAYTVDTDKLPAGWNEETLKELKDDGTLDDICRDYEEFEDDEIEVEDRDD